MNWGSFAEYLSAAGTIFAASTALYLASGSSRVRLKAHVMHAVDELYFEFQNLSRQRVLVKRVELSVGWFGRSKPEQTVDIVFVGGESFPVFIEAGKSYNTRSHVISGSSGLTGRLLEVRHARARWNRQVYLSMFVGNGTVVHQKLSPELLKSMFGTFNAIVGAIKGTR